jgi:hypothetical protein
VCVDGVGGKEARATWQGRRLSSFALLAAPLAFLRALWTEPVPLWTELTNPRMQDHAQDHAVCQGPVSWAPSLLHKWAFP